MEGSADTEKCDIKKLYKFLRYSWGWTDSISVLACLYLYLLDLKYWVSIELI